MEENNKLFIPIILGTAREGRESEKVAKYIERKARENFKLKTEIIDVKELDFTGTEGKGLAEKNPKFKTTIEKADGLIIVTPEYNHGYPGSLKITLDMLFEEYKHKCVGMVGVSRGGFGGARVIENILPVIKDLSLVTIRPDLNFSNVEGLFDEAEKIKDESYNGKVDVFLKELIWMTKTLKWGRENIS
ncbi:NAD(P)H-dependent oxidoreductase [Patescibacteria group bacterium]|nr:NAD(P)H-dependent oxidoreductase [Patescibacteria group bacterium]MBU1074535.1 NAD(P)H-dependent oxidoreductase [Patescibacteria group bacterium]